MKKHLKDKKITIYRKVEGGLDEDGFPIPAGWRPIHPGRLWAYVRQLSAKEVWAAQAATELYQEERFFAINWRDDVTPDMVVLYKDTWYGIVRIDPFEDYKGDIKLYVKGGVTGRTPDGGDILPYA